MLVFVFILIHIVHKINFMGLHAVLLVLVYYHILFHYRVRCNPLLKTIETKHGDIYDCVDFYKQIAKYHPLLMNQTFDFQKKSFTQFNKSRELDYSEVEVCPIGSVPIRRITKYGLAKEMEAYGNGLMDTTNLPGTYLAVVKTKGGQGKYIGAFGWISINNPKAFGQQFSTTRIKLQSGHDSIEAGWRVDPTLYGDNKTRLFVRTDAGGSHCFNIRCPGFVFTSHEIPIDYAFFPMPVPEEDPIRIQFQIIQDRVNGNWNLVISSKNIHIGFWPSNIFNGLPDYIEWGAAVYSPPGLLLPQMGSGKLPIKDLKYDAFICNMKVVGEKGEVIDANNIEAFANNPTLYSVVDFGMIDNFGRTMLYGGPEKLVT